MTSATATRMTTNREWLYGLDVADLADWFDAEHAEQNECDEMKAFANRLECAAHDKLGVTLFGVDYVTEDFMLHVRDTLTAERDELREKLGDTTEAISELMKKQPRTFDPHDVPGSLRLVGRYIDELELRLVGKPECDICDRTTLLVEIEKLRDERDGWKAKAKSILNAESYKFASEPDAESYTDCGKVENDSREKLEADLRKEIREYAGEFYEGEEVLFALILALLDRQAAITERELCKQCDWPSLAAQPDEEAYERIANLTDDLETAYAKNRVLRAHISKMQNGRNGWHIKAEKLQKQVDELTAERDALADDLLTCNKEREQYRELFSKSLTLAAEIVSLQP